MKAKSLLLGFIAGGITAGIATLLSAPSSGVDTVKNLRAQKEVLKEQLLGIKNDLMVLKESVTTLSKEGKAEISGFVQEIKTLIESWQEEISPHQQHLQNELVSIQKAIQEFEETLNIGKKEVL